MFTKPRPRCSGGFTLIELLVVIAIIAILAAILLPVLARAKQQALGVRCISNMRQLAMAWIMYYGDNKGALPVNGDTTYQPPTPTSNTDPQWCPGLMAAVSGSPGTQPTNILWLEAGVIFPYVNNVGVYCCPADPSTYNDPTEYYRGGPGVPRVRSMSMNGYLNGDPNYDGYAAKFTIYRHEADLVFPGAANLWLFIDENPFSINDGFFINNPVWNGVSLSPNTSWTDCPASYHNGAGGMAFCDGHAIIKRWRDPTVLNWNTTSHAGQTPGQTPDTDLTWLLMQTTAYK
ncbi:MAG TPA: prepilin-type N-terminal cleavage/methylation domain-containing protein [Candidatus Acidoferrales bacterium]|jgi:prepilin-type N-terminal cleavage/methylation domain-containing protein/prepilin-type processing-associated H-X9-DG protein|nr:prepilin-type N-terminal cleavage/methylation domain-containing protein [Candidatus Acidoferrales bacterium]